MYPSPISCPPWSHASAENSEPIGPDASSLKYQPSYASQPTYGPTLTPAGASVPMRAPSHVPTGEPHGISSPQYPPASFEPPVQTRVLRTVSQNSRSYARQAPVSQQVDDSKPTHHDWRCHPLFRRSRCTGQRKALCVRASALTL